MDLGFHQAGLHGVRSIDFDKVALQNLEANLGTQATCMNLGEFGDEHRELLEGADIILAGPPCQGFSTAGRNDPDDYRNDHVWNVARIAGLVKPKVVLIENVRGLLNPKNAKHFEKTISVLRQNGYTVSWDTYNLMDYGIAQRRVRVIIMAVLSDRRFQLQIPNRERVSIKSALNDVEKVKDFEKRDLDPSSDEMLIAKQIAPGQKLSNVRSGPASVHTWDIPKVFGSVAEQEKKCLQR